MKQLIRELIDEILAVCKTLSEEEQYGSVREYAGLLSDVIVGFAKLLLGDREEPNAAELAYAHGLLHNPMLRPLDVRGKIEAELARRAGHLS